MLILVTWAFLASDHFAMFAQDEKKGQRVTLKGDDDQQRLKFYAPPLRFSDAQARTPRFSYYNVVKKFNWIDWSKVANTPSNTTH